VALLVNRLGARHVSPGCGLESDSEIASACEQRRPCSDLSLLINSGTLIGNWAICCVTGALRGRHLDHTQMERFTCMAGSPKTDENPRLEEIMLAQV